MSGQTQVGVCLATTAAHPGGVWRHIRDLADAYAELGIPVRLDLPARATRLHAEARAHGHPVSARRFPREVFHAHLADTYDRSATLALARARAAGAAVVVTEHLPRSDASDRRLASRPPRPGATAAKTALKQLQLALADRVIAVSSGSAAFLRERYRLSSDKVATVFNGVRPEAVTGDAAGSSGGPGCPRLVATGAVIWQKGFDVLVAAAARARTDWRVDVFGTGHQLEEVTRAATATRLSDGGPRVLFHGWTDDVAAQVRAADALVMPSRWEAMPYSALEAMTWAKPVVATSVDGLTDLVLPGVTGVLVRPEDPDALAAALDGLGADAAANERLGAAGRERVGSAFGLDTMVRRTLAVYQRSLERLKVALPA